MARTKRAPEQVFMDRLVQLCKDSANGRVSSNTLEYELGWTVEGRFTKIRKSMINQGKVRALPGGAGGSLECIRSVEPEAPNALKAFISYSHADRPLKIELLKHLDPLRRAGLTAPWHDGDITVGKEWEEEIWANFRSADIIILLITVDFINSEYCYDKEVAEAIERHKAKTARVIPVIGKSCLWQELDFKHLHATLNGKAISSHADQDEALTQVAREIRKAAEELRAERAVA